VDRDKEKTASSDVRGH